MTRDIDSGGWPEMLRRMAAQVRAATLAVFLLAMAGCAILPFPANFIQPGVDLALINETGRSSSEHLASEITDEDCHWARILDNVPVCMSPEEEQEYIRSMNCSAYTLNWLGLPRCADDEIQGQVPAEFEEDGVEIDPEWPYIE